MFKNVSSQKIAFFAFDITTGAAKTGDAGNITAYVDKDWAGVNALGDTSATEISSSNAPGWYLFDLTQGETNADALLFTATSTTGSISLVGQLIFTTPPSFTSFVTPTGAAVNVTQWNGTNVATPDTAGYPKVTIKSGTGTGEINLSSGGVATRGNIKKNAAYTGFTFMMTDSTNHNPVTGKTVTVTRSIDGAAFASGTLGSVTEVGSGIYTVDFGSGDLNGNTIILLATASGCDNTYVRIVTEV